MRRGILAYHVLALLDQGPCYGRALVVALAAGPGITTSASALYPLLNGFAHERLIAPSTRSQPRCPPRRYFELTGAGRAALEAFEQRWPVLRDGLQSVVDERAHRRIPGAAS